MPFRKVDVYYELVILSDDCSLKRYTKSDLPKGSAKPMTLVPIYIALRLVNQN